MRLFAVEFNRLSPRESRMNLDVNLTNKFFKKLDNLSQLMTYNNMTQLGNNTTQLGNKCVLFL